jgi:hypothetical protein
LPGAKSRVKGKARPEPVGHSGICGDASLVTRNDGATRVVLRLKGLRKWSSHTAAIHDESCDGKILFPLNNVIADGWGPAKGVTLITIPIDYENWWTNTGGLACGKLELRQWG